MFSKGIHRVAVIDEATGAIKGILTQSNVVDFLLSKAKDVPSTLKTVWSVLVGIPIVAFANYSSHSRMTNTSSRS